MTPLKTLRLEAKALSGRYPITEEYRSALVKKMMQTVLNPPSPAMFKTAVNALVALEKLNQEDDRRQAEGVNPHTLNIGVHIENDPETGRAFASEILRRISAEGIPETISDIDAVANSE